MQNPLSQQELITCSTIREYHECFFSGHNMSRYMAHMATDHNMSRYMAFFPDYQLDRGHVLEPDAPPGNDIFTSNYLPYPDSVKLQRNTNLPNVDKEYSTDDNSSTDESISFSSSDEKEATGNESDESYV